MEDDNHMAVEEVFGCKDNNIAEQKTRSWRRWLGARPAAAQKKDMTMEEELGARMAMA
jgi:hypothetical protein